MFSDLRELENNTIIETDLCLIGAGAAGISIANEFIGSNIQVCLIESGDFYLELATQQLYEVENVGLPRNPSVSTRLRFFGGTTNHWDGRCAPLNDIDFEPRKWVPYSGWPFNSNELNPYYKRANSVCDLGEYIYDDRLLKKFNIPNPGLNTDKLQTQVWKFSPPTRFSLKYRESLKKSKNIQVILNANVTNIQTNDSASHVKHIDIATLEGKKGKVKSKIVVLCCGGIENARLLLLSNTVTPNGLANRHDVVGRFFMEHLRSKSTVVHFGDPFSMKRIFNKYQHKKNHYLLGLRTSKNVQKNKEILNAGAMFYFEGNPDSATHSAANIAKSIKTGHIPNEFNKKILSVISDFDELIVNFRRKYLRPNASTLINNMTVLVLETEQAPNPDSRISLSSSRDVLGLQKSKVDWKLSEIDKQSSIKTTNLLSAEFARLYNSRFRIQGWMIDERENWAQNFRDVAHHMGTTRMSDNPNHGVVDKNCRVHGIDNLYIAGSSVFPTSGHVNPTLTIVALALRLSDQLKTELS